MSALPPKADIDQSANVRFVPKADIGSLFDHLVGALEIASSGKGLCCSFADGFSVQDVDWGHPGWALSANRPSSSATSWSGTSIVVNKTHGLPD